MNKFINWRTSDIISRITFIFMMANTTSCAQSQQRPQDIEELFRNFFIEYVELRPETGSSIGIPPEWGIAVRNDALDDVSENGVQKVYDLYRKYSNWLSKYDQTKLSRSQRIASSASSSP